MKIKNNTDNHINREIVVSLSHGDLHHHVRNTIGILLFIGASALAMLKAPCYAACLHNACTL